MESLNLQDPICYWVLLTSTLEIYYTSPSFNAAVPQAKAIIGQSFIKFLDPDAQEIVASRLRACYMDTEGSSHVMNARLGNLSMIQRLLVLRFLETSGLIDPFIEYSIVASRAGGLLLVFLHERSKMSSNCNSPHPRIAKADYSSLHSYQPPLNDLPPYNVFLILGDTHDNEIRFATSSALKGRFAINPWELGSGISTPRPDAENEGQTSCTKRYRYDFTVKSREGQPFNVQATVIHYSSELLVMYRLTPPPSKPLQASLSTDSLSLKQLMDQNVPVNLTGRANVPNSFKAAHGGFATVYHGVMDGRAVAVKVLRATKNSSRPEVWEKTLERRLRREMNVWAALSHPNIVQFLGYCEGFGDFLAMVSMWCSKGTARDYLRVHNRLTVKGRLILVDDVAQGLAYLHHLKVIHGDLKPTNILVDDKGVAQLCDFGLVRLDDWQGPAGMTTTTPYTGTERYKAPELFATLQNKHPVASFEGDIYAMGCIALEFVDSRIPYHSYNNLLEMRQAIENRDPPTIRKRNIDSEFDRLFWDLIEACWSWYPENRPHVREIVGAVAHLSNLEDQHEGEDYPMN